MLFFFTHYYVRMLPSVISAWGMNLHSTRDDFQYVGLFCAHAHPYPFVNVLEFFSCALMKHKTTINSLSTRAKRLANHVRSKEERKVLVFHFPSYVNQLRGRRADTEALVRTHGARTLRRRNSFCTSDAGMCGQQRRTHLIAVALEHAPSPSFRDMARAAALASNGAKGGSSTHRFLFPSPPPLRLTSCGVLCPAAVHRPATCCFSGFGAAAARRRKRSAAVLIAIVC
jgi:hypothetical protein